MGSLQRIGLLLQFELYRTFTSPSTYWLLTLFLLVSGFFFAFHIEQTLQASLRPVLVPLAFLSMIFAPLISMASFAEECKTGTLEILLTAPLHPFEVVLAKFCHSLLFFLFLLLPTLSYLGVFYYYGAHFPKGPTFTFYLGLILLNAHFLSLGLFVSSLTSSQVLSGFLTFSLLFLLYLLYWLELYLAPSFWSRFLAYFSWQFHLNSFEKGLLSSQNTLFFLANTGFFLFLTNLSLKWKQEGGL